ncbi:acylphosphatase [Hazenella sp. IB182357]|uniref:acylphosphatase n=1 Tax=Polycladospora coralii TaxID=2771432 RepID=A0A926NAS2_9BACL|nr:acylphosphatase [Polycladospora coralii]MBD1372657.1 acylphosphatase [Polycladospora coralii]MBS7531051.1 acylphosphatase [Polycladospora coralii]
MKSYHIMVHGKVQKVGFRKFVHRMAKRYQLTGWVKNRTDGAVEMEVQGKEENIALFLKKIKRGSLLARVERIDVDERHSVDDFNSFLVKI